MIVGRDRSNSVRAGRQQTPILSVSRRQNVVLNVVELVFGEIVGLHDDLGVGDGSALRVVDVALDADVREPHVLVQRVEVVLPVLGERVARREFGAAELDGELEAVGGQVVVVLHAAAHRVPLGAVGDAVREVVGDHVALDAVLRRHVRVQVGVEQCQVLEQTVVRRGRIFGLMVVRVIVRVVDD